MGKATHAHPHLNLQRSTLPGRGIEPFPIETGDGFVAAGDFFEFAGISLSGGGVSPRGTVSNSVTADIRRLAGGHSRFSFDRSHNAPGRFSVLLWVPLALF